MHVITVLPSELEHGVHKNFDVFIRHLNHRVQRYMMPKIEAEYRQIAKAKLADFQYLYSDKLEDDPTLADLVGGKSPRIPRIHRRFLTTAEELGLAPWVIRNE